MTMPRRKAGIGLDALVNGYDVADGAPLGTGGDNPVKAALDE
jgi:hypothetical protein